METAETIIYWVGSGLVILVLAGILKFKIKKKRDKKKSTTAYRIEKWK